MKIPDAKGNRRALSVHRKQGLFLSVHVDEIKMAVRKQNMSLVWEKWMKLVALGKPTSFLDHVCSVCTQLECKPNESTIEQSTKMFESRISAGAAEKLSGWENPHAMRVAWMENMFETASSDTAKWETKRQGNCAKSQVHALLTINSKKIWDLLENCQKFAPRLSWKSLYLARIGKLDFLWSVNKLARAVTKWTRVCRKRVAHLIACTHHTNDHQQYCHVGNTAKQCRLGLFQDSDFAGDLEDSKSTSGGTLCVSGSHTFVPISWMCEKQTSVSHSFTESEVISLDAGLQMNGIPAVDQWDLVIGVLHSSKHTHQAVRYHCRKEMVDDQVPRSRTRSEIQITNPNTKSTRKNNREFDDRCTFFWEQWSCDQNDHDETRVQNPQSCVGLVVW